MTRLAALLLLLAWPAFGVDDTCPSSAIHPDGAFRHTLLGGEITLFNAAKFAVGIAIALVGFFVGGWGADRTVTRGLGCGGLSFGWFAFFLGAGIAILGACVAIFPDGAWRAVGCSLTVATFTDL